MNKLKERLKKVNPDIRNSFAKSDLVAQFISDKLLEKKWSKGQLAKEMGIKSQSLITRYMSGQHNFTFGTITALEKAFGCEIISVAKIVEEIDNPISDDNVSKYLDQWYSNSRREDYFMVKRNFFREIENEQKHFNLPRKANLIAI